MGQRLIISENERDHINGLHNLNEALGGGEYDSSSLERLKSKYPNGFTVPFTVNASGSATFKNGLDAINPENQKIKEIVSAIYVATGSSPTFPFTYGNIKTTVVVNGGASAVGSSNGYDNKKLAERRRDNLITYLKSIKDIIVLINNGVLILTPGDAFVGKNTIKNSPEAEKEQYVSVTITSSKNQRVDVKGEVGDNTNVALPNYPRNGKNEDGVKPTPGKGVKKRVCVQIPENLVKDYQMMIRDFSKKHNLGKIPWGVSDIKK